MGSIKKFALLPGWGKTDHNVHSRVIQTYLMGNIFSSNEQDRGGQRPVSQPDVCSVQDRIPGQHSAQGQWVWWFHYHYQICKSSWWWCFQPGGGNVKIENRKLEWSAQARTKMVNENYTPGGGDKKVNTTRYFCPLHQIFLPQIENRKLNWNAQSKIKSLDNHSHKPGGGDKKIENRKLEWNVDSRWTVIGGDLVTWPQYSPLIGPGSGQQRTSGIRPAAATLGSTTRSWSLRWAVIGGGRSRDYNTHFWLVAGAVQDRVAGQREASPRWRRQEDIRRQGICQTGELWLAEIQSRDHSPHLWLVQMSEQGSVSRSGPGSLNGSVVGSHTQVSEAALGSISFFHS